MTVDPWTETGRPDGYTIPDELLVPPDEEDDGPRFLRYDLSKLARDGIPPPELMCADLIYKGGMHSVAGPPDCGKSTFMCWAALKVIRDGHEFMLLDEESGPEQYAEKMLSLGATAEELGHVHYFPFPGASWTPKHIAELMDLAHDTKPKIIAWDSSAAFLARAGLDEDNAGDVTRFWATVLTPLTRQVEAAVLIADHDVKSTTGSRYARGSGAKLAATDVAFKMEAVVPFSRVQPGSLKLTVSKDRRGWLHRTHAITVTPGATMLFEVTPMDAMLPADASPLQTLLLEVLAHTGDGVTVDRLRDLVANKTGQQRPARESCSRALNALLGMGLVDKLEMGSYQPAYWTKK